MFPTDPNPTQSIVVARMLEFKADLLARDAATILTMGQRWMQLEGALEANIGLLVMELKELEAAGQAINIQRVYKIRRYQTLLAQVQKEMTSYNLWAADYIAQNQIVMGSLGIAHAAEAITLTMLEGVGAVGPFFDKIPFSAVELMVGNAGKGGPVYALLQEAYPTAVENMTNILIKGIAMGIGPGETAKQMVVGMEYALNHALTVATTEQLRVYREASRQQYESTGAVLGYKRFAAKDSLTCALCLALDGEVYPTDELMNVHPRDRCTMIPIVRGVSELTWESGEDWLRGQPEEVQIKTLGPGAHEMWKNGDIELMDLVNKVDHPIWGPSLKRTPLRDLGVDLGGISPIKPDYDPAGEGFTALKEEGMAAGRSVFSPVDAELWFETLDEDEFDAFHHYKTGGSDEINAILRLGEQADEYTQDVILTMHNVLNRSILSEDVTVFRGGTLPPVSVGSIITDQGFMSTSLDKFQSESFIDFWPQQPGTVKSLFEIRIPAGAKGAWIDEVAGGDEAELLMQMGSKMNVIGVNIVDDIHHVLLELIP